ncbi:MAG: hypothetical protein JWP00_548 [Chloroflexi bacterium]|jgi:hypothetical protein|nr:hypothetical protein [Chloroflexota bacterium]
MDNKDLFYEIEELDISENFKANMIIVENNGTGPAYLGWCESLAIDMTVAAPLAGDGPASVLVLPFADVGLLTRKGNPIPAPDNWRERVVRSLEFQDYLLVTLEEDLELNAITTY